MADVDEKVWCAYGDGSAHSFTATFEPADIPEDGPQDSVFSPSSWEEVSSSGNFEAGSGGIDNEFGQTYYAEKD